MSSSGATNWAGNITFSGPVHRPSSIAELRRIVVGADRVRVVGSRHSFNDIADTPGVLISLDGLRTPIEVNKATRTVTLGGGERYARLCRVLDESGVALHNLGSLPHISVAGAVATATHGSGDGNGNLATAVSGLEIMTADGALVSWRRDTHGDRLAGAVVSLGMLGVVVGLTVDVRPAFPMRQWVYDALPWPSLIDNVDAIFAAGYSVSVFTRWRPEVAGMVWIKRLADDQRRGDPDLFGARLAEVARHPIAGMPVRNATEQHGTPGRWHERLPHFRAEFMPSAGDELQSEYLVPRHHAVAAIEAVQAIGDHVSPVLQVGELRTVAADELWLSPAYRQDLLAMHFTWVSDPHAVLPVVSALESVLAPFDARPHWGKIFTTPPDVVRSLYPRLPDFADLAREIDPSGTFRNAFVDRYVP